MYTPQTITCVVVIIGATGLEAGGMDCCGNGSACGLGRGSDATQPLWPPVLLVARLEVDGMVCCYTTQEARSWPEKTSAMTLAATTATATTAAATTRAVIPGSTSYSADPTA